MALPNDCDEMATTQKAQDQAGRRGSGEPLVDFRTRPERYRHWRLGIEGRVATLTLDVDEQGGLGDGYELKLNSYDLAVDIELFDAVQRLRFEHPEVAVVVVTSGKDRVFCAGANIRMLGSATHAHKVNFCKFTNETRLAIEDASAHSGQRYLCAIKGSAAGGGYELALSTDHILLVDDGSTSVSLPEVPMLGVLPGTGGLPRLTDKRLVRRDLADFFCSVEEGVRGRRALDWRLVDEIAPSSRFDEAVRERAAAIARNSDRPADTRGIVLKDIERDVDEDGIRYRHVQAALERERQTVHLTLRGPDEDPPADVHGMEAQGSDFWPLALARELDDLVLHLRLNEPTLGTIVLHSRGSLGRVAAHDAFLLANEANWLVREVLLLWKRTLKRLDMTSRTLFALVEPGSCFAGTLLEIVLAADRSFMLDGRLEDEGEPPAVHLTAMNFGSYPGVNGLTRLGARALDDPAAVSRARQQIDRDLDAEAAHEHRLVTFIPDDIDWEDEIRIALEERAGFSPDALVGLEANLRCPGPETMESKIFGRLSAWQNWIFQRPNAVGEKGALPRYGTGLRAEFDKRRV